MEVFNICGGICSKKFNNYKNFIHFRSNMVSTKTVIVWLTFVTYVWGPSYSCESCDVYNFVYKSLVLSSIIETYILFFFFNLVIFYFPVDNRNPRIFIFSFCFIVLFLSCMSPLIVFSLVCFSFYSKIFLCSVNLSLCLYQECL